MELETLRIIWWLLIGFLFTGFAILDGFDLGAAILLPFITRDETERRIVLNTIGPVWEGNQVWIILGAGAIFAAWPLVYAAAFSGAYFAVLLLLLTMGISRPVSFKYRSKLPNHFWRRFWDWIVFIGGFIPALTFGILIGNLLQGLPFSLDNTLRIFYSGTFFALFHPFALWCGLTSLCMLTMHGGLYLAIKTEMPLRARAIRGSQISMALLIFFFAGGGVFIAHHVMGYQVMSTLDHNGYSNPLYKDVARSMGNWLLNYQHYPILQMVPMLGFIGAFFSSLFAQYQFLRLAFVCSSVSIIGIIGTVGVSMFPFILPSSTHFPSSLLVWDASSSYVTLSVMLFAVCIFLPVVMLYTSWVYRIMRGPVTRKMIEDENKHAY